MIRPMLSLAVSVAIEDSMTAGRKCSAFGNLGTACDNLEDFGGEVIVAFAPINGQAIGLGSLITGLL